MKKLRRTGAWMVSLMLPAVVALSTTPAGAESPLKDPKIAVELPEQFNTPDGMTLDAEGNIILAVPNAHEREGGAWLLKITPEDNLEKYFFLPPHPETNKACPLGISFGSDGHLYIADGQTIGGNPQSKARLLRVVHVDGKPVKCEVLVTGLVQANGLETYGDKVYVCESQFEPVPTPTIPMESGVFCFDLEELDPENPIQVKPKGNDPHCIFKFRTHNEDWRVGANGLGFSADGKMYVCNFGDASLLEVLLEDDMKTVKSWRACAQGDPMESTDGLKVDQDTGLVYIADFVGNSVHRVDPASGEIVMLAKSPIGTGADGDLDRCSEVCLRDGKVYVANIDLPFGNENDKPYTISVIDLEE